MLQSCQILGALSRPRFTSERGLAGAWIRTGRVGVSLSLIAILTFIFIVPTLALDLPSLAGRVVDDAGILDQTTRATLTRKLADLEAVSTDQLVVVTLKSLQGTTIEDFGVQLGRRWQIGQKDKNNGVLLIVAPSERKVRIEVGYGLEGKLTDAVTRLIIENAIIPRFRANDFPGGIMRGVDDIISVLTGDAAEWKQRAAKRPDAPDWLSTLIGFVVLGIFALVPLMVLGGIFATVRNASKSGRRPHGRTAGKRSGSSDTSSGWSWSSGSSSSSSAGSSGGDFSGGGGSFGGGGSSGSW